jgi:hypothetical protein
MPGLSSPTFFGTILSLPNKSLIPKHCEIVEGFGEAYLLEGFGLGLCFFVEPLNSKNSIWRKLAVCLMLHKF